MLIDQGWLQPLINCPNEWGWGRNITINCVDVHVICDSISPMVAKNVHYKLQWFCFRLFIAKSISLWRNCWGLVRTQNCEKILPCFSIGIKMNYTFAQTPSEIWANYLQGRCIHIDKIIWKSHWKKCQGSALEAKLRRVWWDQESRCPSQLLPILWEKSC